MALKLDRLSPNAQVTQQGGAATSWFSNLWQRTMTAIEGQINALVGVLAGTVPFTVLNVNGATVATLGDAATRNVGTTAGTVAAGDDSRIVHPPWGFGFEKDLSSVSPGVSVADFVSAIPWTLPAGLGSAAGRVSDDGTPPIAQTDFDIHAAGVSVGTMRFAASATSATFIKAADTAVAANAKVQLFPPASLNGMAGRLYGSVVGVRG